MGQASALPSVGHRRDGRMAGSLTSSWLAAASPCCLQPRSVQGPKEPQLADSAQPVLPRLAAATTGEKRSATNPLCLSREHAYRDSKPNRIAPTVIFASGSRASLPSSSYCSVRNNTLFLRFFLSEMFN